MGVLLVVPKNMASMDNEESTFVLLKRVDYLGIVTLVCGTTLIV